MIGVYPYKTSANTLSSSAPDFFFFVLTRLSRKKCIAQQRHTYRPRKEEEKEKRRRSSSEVRVLEPEFAQVRVPQKRRDSDEHRLHTLCELYMLYCLRYILDDVYTFFAVFLVDRVGALNARSIMNQQLDDVDLFSFE